MRLRWRSFILEQENRFFSRDFAFQSISRLLGGAELETSLNSFVAENVHATQIVPAIGTGELHVLQPEFLQPVLRFFEAPLIPLDLLFDKSLRVVVVLAVSAEAGFHKNGQKRLDNALGILRLWVERGNHKQIVPAARDTDVFCQPIDEVVLLLWGLHCEIDVVHPNQLLHVRATDQRSRQKRKLLIDVRLHGEPGEEWLKDGFRVDIDARTRLVSVWDSQHANGTD